MPKPYYRTFKPKGVGLVKDKPVKPNRKSGFRMLAGAKKYECKALLEYMLLRWENEYEIDLANSENSCIFT